MASMLSDDLVDALSSLDLSPQLGLSFVEMAVEQATAVLGPEWIDPKFERPTGKGCGVSGGTRMVFNFFISLMSPDGSLQR